MGREGSEVLMRWERVEVNIARLGAGEKVTTG